MKFKGNVAALTMCLSMLSPVSAQNPADELDKTASIEEIHLVKKSEDTATHQISAEIDHENQNLKSSTSQEISTAQAIQALEEFRKNLIEGHEFVLGDTPFIVNSIKKMTEEEQEAVENMVEEFIEEVGSGLIQSTISAIVNTIQNAYNSIIAQQISQTIALALLEEFINKLAAGQKFTINGVSYIITDSTKLEEISTEEN